MQRRFRPFRIRGDERKIAGQNIKTQMDKTAYLEHFKVTEENLRELTGLALSKGGDFADLYFEHTVYNELSMRDGQVNSGGSHIDYGMGIRVLKGEKTGYAYTESTEWEDMRRAALNAAMIADSPSGTEPGYAYSDGLLKNRIPGKHYWSVARIEEYGAAKRLPLLKRLGDRVAESDGRVIKVRAKIADSFSMIMMYNSIDGLSFDSRPLTSVTAAGIFKDGAGNTETNSASRSFRMGFDLLSAKLIDEVAADVTKGIDERFAAIRPKGGEMPVVMGAGGSGILLHEAIGHAFEADFIRKKQSVFSEQFGKTVCDPSISVVDDGTLAYNRGSVNVDDEGVPGQKTYMVRSGKLESFLHDRISAAHFKTAPTGNGRRESFRFPPIPRMRSTYMENGNCSPEDIIAEVRHGIYVDDFSNGQVKIGEGDFTFYVKNGRLIENGKLTAPIKDINIIGNGPKALSDIVAVGNDLKIDNGTWTCGKEQNCVVTCGIPTVLVRSLTVGGEA